MSFLQGRIALGNGPQDFQPLGRENPSGYFDPDHLDVGLALAVDSLLEPEGSELGGILLSRLIFCRLDFKVLNLFVDEGNDTRG